MAINLNPIYFWVLQLMGILGILKYFKVYALKLTDYKILVFRYWVLLI